MKKLLNFLPNKIILNWSKLRAFADNKIYATGKCFGKGRKHYGKMSKCWLPAFFLFFSLMFSKAFYHWVDKLERVLSRDNPLPNNPCFS